MEIKQVYNFVNTATEEALGRSGVVNEDLSNIVDVGDELFNSNAVDRYVRALVNHIGRVIFVNRAYAGSAPSVLMDGWEFGSVMEKIQIELPNAVENESWDLINGASYDPNIFTAPQVTVKFYNKRVTFEVDMSIAERQVKQSFSDASQLNGFISAVFNAVERSMTVKLDELIMRTINNFIADTVHDEYSGEALSSKSGVRAVNLLYLYKNFTGDSTITAANALSKPEFIRFASYTIANYITRMGKMSSLFNIGGKSRFTTKEMLHAVLHSDFASAASVYLQSSTFHNEYTALPNADLVPYWQGSGERYSWEDSSKIMVTTSTASNVTVSGIVGVLWDRDALGVANMNRRVTTNYNGKAEFYNNFFKWDAQYFNDQNENFVVFFVA